MKSGGPWNLRGLRPETREAAREAARRSGMSVGEWLNSVIRPGDDDYGRPMRFADYDDEDDDGWRYEDRDGPRADYRAPRRRRDREAALAREEIGEVHARLDRLTRQLERLTRSTVARLTGAPASTHRGRPRRRRRRCRARAPATLPERIADRSRSTLPSPRSPNVSACSMATPLPLPARRPKRRRRGAGAAGIFVRRCAAVRSARRHQQPAGPAALRHRSDRIAAAIGRP